MIDRLTVNLMDDAYAAPPLQVVAVTETALGVDLRVYPDLPGGQRCSFSFLNCAKYFHRLRSKGLEAI